MSIMASVSLLVGIVLGLRFNVRLLLLACVLVIGAGLAATLFGSVSLADAALFAIATTVALQVGYFVSMVIGAMQLVDTPEESPSRPCAGNAARRGAEPRRM